jgi:ferredoxin
VCEPECPPGAILPDTEPEAEKWAELNRQYASGAWPNITRKRPAPEDADEYKDEKGKHDKYFSANPARAPEPGRRGGPPGHPRGA